MNRLVGISELRQDAARLLKRVQADREPWVILSRSRPVGVLMGPEAYEEMRERLRQLQEEALLHDVEASEAEFRAGKARRLRSLKDLR